MRFFSINTDRHARSTSTADIWFAEGMAFAGDFKDKRGEHARVFDRLGAGDILFMYHSGVGYVGVGEVLSAWDHQVFEGDARLLYAEESFEYRVPVRWFRDWRNSARGGEDGLPVPRGGTWQEIDPTRYPLVRVYSSSDATQTLEEAERDFESALQASQDGGSEDRRRRLDSANPRPVARTVLATIYARNPDVVAEVLKRASGICEHCTRPAPFAKKSNGSPYLEVHHRIMLSAGGLDTVANAIALCPNCHRMLHYGP